MLIVGGENLIDLIECGTQDGDAIFKAVPGGSPYNVALAAGRQGIDVGYLTPISADGLGDRLAHRLRESHVKVIGDRVAEPTSLAMVSLETHGPSYAFYREQTAERQIEWESLKAAITPQVTIFHIGSLALTGGPDTDLWEQLADYCHASGIVLSLDPNIRPSFIQDPDQTRARLQHLFAMANILKLSNEDLDWIYNGLDETAALNTLLDQTQAGLIVITRGAQGASFWHDDGRSNLSWHDVSAEPTLSHEGPNGANRGDSVGAGDTFMASLNVWLTKSNRLKDLDRLAFSDKSAMVRYAAKAAAITCSRQGCDPPISAELPLV